MDPLACLMRAARALYTGRASDDACDEAFDALDAYRAWRLNGGFEPMTSYGIRGDRYAAQLARSLAKACGEL